MHDTHPDFAPQLLRYIAQNIESEPGEVRIQALTLSSKLVVCGTESQVPMYLLKLCERDTEFDVRDRARFLLALLETKNEKLQGRLKQLLFPERKAPIWVGKEIVGTEYQIGTFSQFFGKEVSGYEPLPDWVEESEIPDETVRTPVRKSVNGEIIVVNNKLDDPENLDVNTFFDDEDDGEAEEEPDTRAEYSDGGEYYEYDEEQGQGYTAFESTAGKPSAPPQNDEDLDDFFG
jgi:AP-3 complex subunit beta